MVKPKSSMTCHHPKRNSVAISQSFGHMWVWEHWVLPHSFHSMLPSLGEGCFLVQSLFYLLC